MMIISKIFLSKYLLQKQGPSIAMQACVLLLSLALMEMFRGSFIVIN